MRYLLITDVAGTTGEHTAGKVPEVGRVIAWLSSRPAAWRVFRIDEIHQANWHEQTWDVWRKAGEPPWETWKGREVGVGVEPPHDPAPNGKDRRGLRLALWAHNAQWAYLEEPWPACTRCGLLWPCPCYAENRAAEAAVEEFDRVARIMPGCCWGCGEPVTARQHSIVFEGDNLLLPGAGPAVFHTSASRKAARGPSGNQTCRSEAEAYEEQWAAAAEGRPIRLRCPGTMWSHFGYRECTNPACPGDGAAHRDWGHCTVGHYIWDGESRQLLPLTNCAALGCKGPKVAQTAEAVEHS